MAPPKPRGGSRAATGQQNMPLDAAVMPSRSGADAPLVRRKRIDGRTKSARQIKRRIADYSQRIGDAAANPLVRTEIVKLAELETLIDDRRGAALRHESVDLVVLNRMETNARQLRRALNIDGLPPPPRPMTIAEYERRKREAVS